MEPRKPKNSNFNTPFDNIDQLKEFIASQLGINSEHLRKPNSNGDAFRASPKCEDVVYDVPLKCPTTTMTLNGVEVVVSIEQPQRNWNERIKQKAAKILYGN